MDRRLNIYGTCATVLIFAAIFLFAFNQFKEADSFYHLKTGQVIWETGIVPPADIFSYTAAGVPWVTHEWLAEVILYGLYALAGYWGVMAAVALLAVAAYFLLWLLAREGGAEPAFAALLLFLVGYLTFELWIPRPQAFGFFFFALLLFCLEKYRRRGRSVYLAGVILTMWLWGNSHASVLLGYAVLLLYLTAEAVRWSKPGWDAAPPAPRLRAFALAGLVALAAPLLNPNGTDVLFYRSAINSAVETFAVLEWQPIQSFWFLPQTKVFILLMLAAVGCLAYWFGWRRLSRDFSLLGLTAGTFSLPFMSIRHVGFFTLAAGFPLVLAAGGLLANFRQKFSSRRLAAVWLCLAVIIVLLGWFRSPRSYFNPDTVPVHAADFIAAQNIQGRRFNLYNEGGYLIWRFYPPDQVSLDGRSEIYAGRPAEEVLAIIRGEPAADELVDQKYGINHFLLAYRPAQLAESILPLVRRLLTAGWKMVYWDDTSLLIVRDMPAHAGLIEKYAFYRVSPFTDPSLIPPAEVPAALGELRRILDSAPQSRVVAAYAVRLLSLHSDLLEN